jgi:cytoskeletal protein RodZ
MNNTRRQLLATTGTVLLGGLAGCAESSQSQTERHTTAEAKTKTTRQTPEAADWTDSQPTTNSERSDTPTDTQEPTANPSPANTKTPTKITPIIKVQQFTTEITKTGALERELSTPLQAKRKTVIVTDSDWRSQIAPGRLDDKLVTMLDETDYSSAYVAGFEGIVGFRKLYKLNSVSRIKNTIKFNCKIIEKIGQNVLWYRLFLIRVGKSRERPPNTVVVNIQRDTPEPRR